MRRIRVFIKACVVLAASIAGAVTSLVSDALKPFASGGLAPLIVFILTLFALTFISIGIESIASRSRLLRRMLLGHSYVEGYWVDVSRSVDGTLIGAACVYVYYEDEILKISGTTLKATEGMYASWDVKFATLQEHTLAYAFESHTSSATSPVELGYAELKFSHGTTAPSSYSGFFFDTTNKSLISLEGLRVTDPGHIAQLDSPSERRAFLTSVLESAKSTNAPKLPAPQGA